MDELDPAVLRRFDLKLKFDWLTAGQAAALAAEHFIAIAFAAPGCGTTDAFATINFACARRFRRHCPPPPFCAICECSGMVADVNGGMSVKGTASAKTAYWFLRKSSPGYQWRFLFCRESFMQLQFLGTGAGMPSKSRNVSALALNLDSPAAQTWLFELRSRRTQHTILHTTVRPGRIRRIFITHLHGDHILPARPAFQPGDDGQ